MQPFSATVKNGRLTLDEPCTYAEGEVVILLPLNDLLAGAVEGEEGGGDIALSDLAFEIASAPQRHFRREKAVDAAALIKELRSI